MQTMPIVPKPALARSPGRLDFFILKPSLDLASIGTVMRIATTFLKNAFIKTGMSPARFTKRAITAKDNEDRRR